MPHSSEDVCSEIGETTIFQQSPQLQKCPFCLGEQIGLHNDIIVKEYDPLCCGFAQRPVSRPGCSDIKGITSDAHVGTMTIFSFQF